MKKNEIKIRHNQYGSYVVDEEGNITTSEKYRAFKKLEDLGESKDKEKQSCPKKLL